MANKLNETDLTANKPVKTIDLVTNLQEQIQILQERLSTLLTRVEALEKSQVTHPVPKPNKLFK
jgi:hypothetical protein